MTESNRWVYLDPDNRKLAPEGEISCCRCQRRFKAGQLAVQVEMHEEHSWVRQSETGNYFVGSDCWNKIKNDFVE